MMNNNKAKWYVLKVISGQENKIKKNIESEVVRLKWDRYISEVLIPTEKTIQIKNNKKIIKEKNNYPGYIMIQASLEGEVISVLKSIVNVVGFLGEEKGGSPVSLREAEVNRMLGKKEENEMINTDVEIYQIGNTVKVVDGPFNGFDGTIEEINKDKLKLKVTIKIFGRKTPLELNYGQVEKI